MDRVVPASEQASLNGLSGRPHNKSLQRNSTARFARGAAVGLAGSPRHLVGLANVDVPAANLDLASPEGFGLAYDSRVTMAATTVLRMKFVAVAL